jgi:hypothetical protein
MDIPAQGQGYQAYDRRGEGSQEEAASCRVVVIVFVGHTHVCNLYDSRLSHAPAARLQDRAVPINVIDPTRCRGARGRSASDLPRT